MRPYTTMFIDPGDRVELTTRDQIAIINPEGLGGTFALVLPHDRLDFLDQLAEVVAEARANAALDIYGHGPKPKPTIVHDDELAKGDHFIYADTGQGGEL